MTPEPRTREHPEPERCDQSSVHGDRYACGNLLPCSNPAHRGEHLEATYPLREALEDVLDGWTLNIETDDTTDFEAALGRAREALVSSPEPEWEYRALDADGWLVGLMNPKARCLERRRKAIPAGEWEALPDD